ncbi:MAG: cupin domain-containing protein [Candidatus Nitrosocosmicus sp.]|nr:cupin domain-containing protein [Candidatus Nitrosocosmicus sp.]MDN5867274.1 cupin domain-containing protein [Candidatus Nitrosocosmicus sp.]
MESTNNFLTAVGAKEGPVVSVIGDIYRIIIGSEQTNGAYAIVDMLIPPGGGPVPHSHTTFQEAFYILDGEINIITKEKTYTAKKGSYVNIPFNGPVHKFTNETDRIVHFLCFITPAGMEKMFLEVGNPVAADTLLPIPQLMPEDLKRLQSVAEKYGLKLYPPDYFD